MPTVYYGNHDHAFTSVVSLSAGVVPENSSFLNPSPVASVEVQVGSTNASCFKVDEHSVALDFWFRNLLDFDVVRPVINSGFQKFANL
jgi:hypothetical protein